MEIRFYEGDEALRREVAVLMAVTTASSPSSTTTNGAGMAATVPPPPAAADSGVVLVVPDLIETITGLPGLPPALVVERGTMTLSQWLAEAGRRRQENGGIPPLPTAPSASPAQPSAAPPGAVAAQVARQLVEAVARFHSRGLVMHGAVDGEAFSWFPHHQRFLLTDVTSCSGLVGASTSTSAAATSPVPCASPATLQGVEGEEMAGRRRGGVCGLAKGGVGGAAALMEEDLMALAALLESITCTTANQADLTDSLAVTRELLMEGGAASLLAAVDEGCLPKGSLLA